MSGQSFRSPARRPPRSRARPWSSNAASARRGSRWATPRRPPPGATCSTSGRPRRRAGGRSGSFAAGLEQRQGGGQRRRPRDRDQSHLRRVGLRCGDHAADPIVVSGSVAPKASGVVELQLLQGVAWHNVASAHLSGTLHLRDQPRPAGRLLPAAGGQGVQRHGRSGNSGATHRRASQPPSSPQLRRSWRPTSPAVRSAGPTPRPSPPTGGTAPLVWSATSLPGGHHDEPCRRHLRRPTGVATATVVITVSTRWAHRHARPLTLDVAVASGTLVAWGAGTSGELGNSTTANTNVPVRRQRPHAGHGRSQRDLLGVRAAQRRHRVVLGT